jgi:type II secretory pathway pseudopilin PulG
MMGRRQSSMGSIRDRGSLLIEHLVAMALLSLLVVSVFSMLSTGSWAAHRAKETRLAGTLAAQKLEELTARCDDTTDVSRQPLDPVRFPGYQWLADVTQVAPSLRQVTVTVSWPARGQERSVSLTTLVRHQDDR